MSRVRFPRVSLVQELIVSSVDCFADVAELADALDLGSSGRPCRFDSCMPHHFFKARVVKLVDAMDSKSIDESHIGSSPIAGTILEA